tara:strand:- start:530 stop:1189 length:660 start_codon:yes stop_codon:yes gene_type:complete
MVRYRPYVILNAAMTLDGKIVTVKGDSSISSRTDLIRVHELRANVDAILIGINTVETDNPMLTAKNGKKNPIRVIVDSEARIKFTTKIMRSCNIISTVIAVSHKATNSKLEKIKSRGASVLVCGMNNKVYLKKLLKILKNIGVNRLLVEGGGEINWSMLTNGLVDEIIVTIAPTIVGGRSAITLVEGIGFTKVNNSLKLKLQKIRKIDSEVILYYKIIN